MHSDRIRILHVQALDAIGGTERTNFTLLAGMDRVRFANEICILGVEGPYQAAYAGQGLPTHYLGYNPLRFVRLLHKGDYDVIFLYGLKANLLARLLGPLFSNAVRVEVKHGMDVGRGPLARALDRWTSGLVNYFVSNSSAGARVMAEREGKPRERITVIQNGIDVQRFALAGTADSSRSPAEGLVLISVANFLPCKGHRFLLEAVGKLRQEGIACTLLLAGDGPERAGLERLAQQVAPGSVRFLGCRSDIAGLLAAADILVQASLSEGLPNSVMEAMAAGRPVVATEVGGNGELVRDGETGLLVPSGSAEALAGALRLLAGNPARRRRMGLAGQERIRRVFPLGKMVAGFEGFCLEKARPSRPDILFLTNSAFAVRYLIRDKMEALVAAGYGVRALCGDDAHTSDQSAETLRVDTLKMCRLFRPLKDLRSLVTLLGYLKRHRPRVVHTCTPKAGLLGPLAARLLGIPVVHSVFGLLFHDRGSRRQNLLYRAAERLTAFCAGYLLFQSRADLENIRGLGWKSSDRLLYLGNGVDLERFDPAPYRAQRRLIRAELRYGDGHFVVGMVARLLRTKGVGEFLAVAERLRCFSPLRFLMVGPAESDHARAVSEALMRHAAEADNVLFLGEQQDMPRLYAAMDLFVLPSYREGVPQALLEASAMELPVIATDIRGCREVVERERTGWLVPVRDVEALAEKILECWRDPERAHQFGRAGRVRVQREFDQRVVHERLLRLYAGLLGATAPPASVPAADVLVTES